MPFLDRSRKADAYPWLVWKVRLFVLGGALAVGGMAVEVNWLVALAIPVLIAAFVVRFLPGGKGVTTDPDEGFGE